MGVGSQLWDNGTSREKEPILDNVVDQSSPAMLGLLTCGLFCE